MRVLVIVHPPMFFCFIAVQRFEAVGAFIVAVMLMGAGYGIGNHSFETLREVISGGAHAAIPTRLTAVAASVSIIAKETLFRVGSGAVVAVGVVVVVVVSGGGGGGVRCC